MAEFQIIKDSCNFKCTMCGNCCTGDMTIHLNLYDLYKMCLYLDLNHTDQLFKKNLVRLYSTENNSWQPVILFKKKPLKFCPFLSNEMDEQGNLIGLCELHPDHKPLICAMAPVGRIADLRNAEDEFIFVKPAPDCPGVESNQKQYLSDILKNYERELHYQKLFFHLLEKCIDKKLSKNEYYKNLYSFLIEGDFNRILSEIGNHLNDFKYTHD